MNRYHKDIGFPETHRQRLEQLTNKFNLKKRFGRTNHALIRLRQRFDYMNILNLLATNIKFNIKDIFEFYVNNGVVKKICYKIKYSDTKDLIIVLTPQKDIITVYTNNTGDNHSTLNKELYATV